MNAIALNSSMFNGARVVGPAVAGILIAKIGEGWCFAANAISYTAVIAGLLLMKVHCPLRSNTSSPLADIVEGFRWANSVKVIRALLLLIGLVSLVGMPYTVLMPVFAHKILHGGARGLGILMGATGVSWSASGLILTCDWLTVPTGNSMRLVFLRDTELPPRCPMQARAGGQPDANPLLGSLGSPLQDNPSLSFGTITGTKVS